MTLKRDGDATSRGARVSSSTLVTVSRPEITNTSCELYLSYRGHQSIPTYFKLLYSIELSKRNNYQGERYDI